MSEKHSTMCSFTQSLCTFFSVTICDTDLYRKTLLYLFVRHGGASSENQKEMFKKIQYHNIEL